MHSPKFWRLLFYLIIIVCAFPHIAVAQVVTSSQQGNWNVPSTWSTGIVPDATNSDTILILHEIVIPSGVSITVNYTQVDSKLTVEPGAIIRLAQANDTTLFITTGSMEVHGTIICSDGAGLIGTTTLNTVFNDGAVYRHERTSEGTIPVASWHVNANFEIVGLVENRTMQSLAWSQTFGNLIYSCPNQGDFVEMKGLLRHIAGDFIVSSTNNNVLRFSTTQSYMLQIDGDFIVEGMSQIWLSREGTNTIHVGGDFIFESTASAASYFTSQGLSNFTVGGNFKMNSLHKLKLASQNENGHTNLYLNGDFNFERGTLDALTPGTGTIMFAKQGQQVFTRGPVAVFEGNLDYVVEATSELQLTTHVLSNTTGGNFTLKGAVRVGSSDPVGALQTGGGGNVRIAGDLVYESGATIVYDGTEVQYMGNAHDNPADVVINNSKGVTLTGNGLVVRHLTIQEGFLLCQNRSLTVSGNIVTENENAISDLKELTLTGNEYQTLSFQGTTLENVVIQKEAEQDVELLSTLNFSGLVSLNSMGSDLISNGFLYLRSPSQSLTGGVGPLLNDNRIVGEVTVERFMEGVGRNNRFIGVPVTGATVADWQDDFPITGNFSNPSTGDGLSNAASLNTYNETLTGGLNVGWEQCPPSGLSSDHPLIPGVGYAAFIRLRNEPTVWRVAGEIVQGNFDFDVSYTPSGVANEDGWNLIANPYPCAIRWSEGAGLTYTHIDASIAIKDNKLHRFRYWDGEMGDIEDGVIAMGKAFWVKANAVDPTLSMTESIKHVGDQSFYRSKQHEVDYLEINIDQGNGVSDHSYFRLRKGASQGRDVYDFSKFINDNLTLSILCNEQELAINAVDSVPCTLEIPLLIRIANGYAGVLKISAKAFGMFQGASVKLVDRVLNKEHDLSLSDYSFTLTKSETLVKDRFVMIVNPPIPREADFESDEFVCGDTPFKLKLNRLQPGINYAIEIVSERYELADDSAFNIQLQHLPGDSTYTVSLLVKNYCQSYVHAESKIRKYALHYPLVEDVTLCEPDKVNLLVRNSRPGAVYNWYDGVEASKPIHQGSSFESSTIVGDAEYYVSHFMREGCESERAKVSVSLLNHDSLTITYVHDSLFSSYKKGNVWYYNGELIEGETGPVFHPHAEGIYEVTVDLAGCIIRGQYLYLINEISSEREGDLLYYPNPTLDWLTLNMPIHSQIANILDVTGKSVMYLCPLEFKDDLVRVNVMKLCPGFYFVVIDTGNKVAGFRFEKN